LENETKRMDLMEIKMKASGDSGLIIVFGDSIDRETNKKISLAAVEIEACAIKGIIELVPTYGTILVVYNPLEIGFDELQKCLSFVEDIVDSASLLSESRRTCVIPVCYGGEYGPDLKHVAEHNGLSTVEAVSIHGSVDYLVYMIGFTPGFPYLGGMDERIATPRLLSPREKIPAGSVGIAGSQTGVYPMQSPGGWQIIGRTPLRLFDPRKESPALLSAGMTVRFKSVDEEEYITIEKCIEEGNYEIEIIEKGGDGDEKSQD
jgi:KipI family sensor histidine kinase inhibitor